MHMKDMVGQHMPDEEGLDWQVADDEHILLIGIMASCQAK
jgi:hypothetical protein